MAFSLEMIQTPAQLTEFRSFAFKSPITRKPVEKDRWVVDRGRDMYFVNLGGGSMEMPWFLVLVLKNVGVVRAEGLDRSAGEFDKKDIEVWWDITKVSMETALRPRETEIRQALQDALVAYGFLGDPGVTKAVHVKMAPTQFV